MYWLMVLISTGIGLPFLQSTMDMVGQGLLGLHPRICINFFWISSQRVMFPTPVFNLMFCTSLHECNISRNSLIIRYCTLYPSAFYHGLIRTVGLSYCKTVWIPELFLCFHSLVALIYRWSITSWKRNEENFSGNIQEDRWWIFERGNKNVCTVRLLTFINRWLRCMN